MAALARLRGPGGCPWDQQQTHKSLRRYLVEEAYEALAAIEEGEPAALCDELGDLLLQVVFHARIAEEAGHFDIRDVVAAITGKLVRRHPHVFGHEQVSSLDELHRRWEEAKRREGGRPGRCIPPGLPALRAARRLVEGEPAGGDGTGETAWQRVRARLAELERAPAEKKEGLARLWGEFLLDLAAVGHAAGVDLEDALRDAVRRRQESRRLSKTESGPPSTPGGLP